MAETPKNGGNEPPPKGGESERETAALTGSGAFRKSTDYFPPANVALSETVEPLTPARPSSEQAPASGSGTPPQASDAGGPKKTD